MSKTRKFFTVLVFTLAAVQAFPVRAQIMPTQGIDFSWFRSSQDRAQRDACRRNLPECRASVRAQMEIEESITVLLPWVGLGIAALAGLFWMRAQEKKRERAKKLARLHHTPGAFKALDKEKKTKNAHDDDDEESDRSSFS